MDKIKTWNKIEPMNLYDALRINRHSSVAFVGSGGKTTAMFQLSGQMPPPVAITASTHLESSEIGLAEKHYFLETEGSIVGKKFPPAERILFTGVMRDDNRTHGLTSIQLEALYHHCGNNGIPLLIEADGSRQLPLKAPAAHEPAIPKWVDTVVVVLGFSGFGKPLNDQSVHRAQIFSALSGLNPGENITIEALEKYLLNPLGGLKNIPIAAKRKILITQLATAQQNKDAQLLAEKIIPFYDCVILSAINKRDKNFASPGNGYADKINAVLEPTAGIILAAGGAKRYGDSKILLNWHGKPFIRHIAELALESGLSPVNIVLGSVIEPVLSVLEDLPVNFVINEDWGEGQSTSLRVGVLSLPNNCGSAIFLLADQPQIKKDLLLRMRDEHNKTLAPIILPQVAGKRANPVLFDQSVFSELLGITGDQGGRAIFSRYPIQSVIWEDETILLDVDTPEDYEKLKSIGS
jgi:molybdenum cofactor cytidylyltransferase